MKIPGEKGFWIVPSIVPETEEPCEIEILGQFLGSATSHHFRHNHGETTPQKSGPRCSACRWSVIEIFRTEAGPYVVRYIGRSVLPGETDRYRHSEVTTAPEVVEVLTTRFQGKVFLTKPAARVLAQASAFDSNIQDAYENRAVL